MNYGTRPNTHGALRSLTLARATPGCGKGRQPTNNCTSSYYNPTYFPQYLRVEHWGKQNMKLHLDDHTDAIT